MLSRHFSDRTLATAARGILFDFSRQPVVMGILNTTPDSFFDGGMLDKEKGIPDIDRAIENILAMVADGAGIIDIGGESTRPGAREVSASEEIMRTIPLIERLRKKSDIPISIDTWKADVAEAALKAGADIVNDISGFTFDPSMADVCRKGGAAAILMHTPARPADMGWSTPAGSESRGDVVMRVLRFLEQAAASARSKGVASLAIDPGFGFGKSMEENFALLNRLGEFRQLGLPILVGLSRKSFLARAAAGRDGLPAPPSGRLAPSIATQTIALMHGADIIRAHDVAAATACLRVVASLKGCEGD